MEIKAFEKLKTLIVRRIKLVRGKGISDNIVVRKLVSKEYHPDPDIRRHKNHCGY